MSAYVKPPLSYDATVLERNRRLDQLVLPGSLEWDKMDDLSLGECLDSLALINYSQTEQLLGIPLPMIGGSRELITRRYIMSSSINPRPTMLYVAPPEVRELARLYKLPKSKIVDDRLAPAFFYTLVNLHILNLRLMSTRELSGFWEELTNQKSKIQYQVSVYRYPMAHPQALTGRLAQEARPDAQNVWAWTKDDKTKTIIALQEAVQVWKSFHTIEQICEDFPGTLWIENSAIIPLIFKNQDMLVSLNDLQTDIKPQSTPFKHPWLMLSEDHEKAQEEIDFLSCFERLDYRLIAPGCLPDSWKDRGTLRSRMGLDRMMAAIENEARLEGKLIAVYMRGKLRYEHLQVCKALSNHPGGPPDSIITKTLTYKPAPSHRHVTRS